jgi:hypothetical protein
MSPGPRIAWDIAGLRALAVQAKGRDAQRFYLHFNFIPSPSDPLHLLAPQKDLLALG